MHNSFSTQSVRDDNVVIAHFDAARRQRLRMTRRIFFQLPRDTRTNMGTRLATDGRQVARQPVAFREFVRRAVGRDLQLDFGRENDDAASRHVEELRRLRAATLQECERA
jgi:hypothetical protein